MIATLADSNDLARRTGVTGVYLFGIGSFLSFAASNVAVGLLILAIILDRRSAWPVLRSDPAFWLFIGFTLYLAFALTWAWPPEWRAADIEGSERLLKLWYFLPLAYWLNGDLSRINRFLLCVGAGFLIGRIAAIDWSTPPALISGERLRLGFSSINHFGLYAGTLFLGILAYARTVWQFTAQHPPGLAWFLRSSWAVIALTALYWLLASQSRGAIASLMITLVLAFMLIVSFRRTWTTAFLLAFSGAAVLLAVLLGGEILAHLWPLDSARWSLDSVMLNAILNGDWSSIPYSPVGIRLHMIRTGWEWWLERPWFGYGPGAVESMFLHGAVQELQEYTHLHNTLIDNLVRLGGAGTLLLQSLFLYVAYTLWRRFRAGVVPLSLGVFTLGTLVLAFLFGQTDYRMDGWDWRHYWVVIGGISYSFHLLAGPRSWRPLLQQDLCNDRVN